MAAGKSTRMYPLTLTKPKPLLKIANKTLLEHNIEALRGIADQIIIIVGYRSGMIRENAGALGKDIILVEQKEQLGTGHALMQARPFIKDRFIIMNGDDLFGRKDIERCAKHRLCLLAKQTASPPKQGALITRGRRLMRIEEKPSIAPETNLLNTGLYVFDKSVFDVKLSLSPRGEYEITDAVSELAKTEEFSYEVCRDYWLPIGYPWHILQANKFILNRLKVESKCISESNVIIKGQVGIGEGTTIGKGAYLEGPVIIGENCSIGPGCRIMPYATIGDGCMIGSSAEISNSVIGEKTSVGNSSEIEDSVIGDNVAIGEGCVLSRNQSVCASGCKDILVDPDREILGAVVADGTRLGNKTYITNGSMVWPGKTVPPGQVIKQDLQ